MCADGLRVLLLLLTSCAGTHPRAAAAACVRACVRATIGGDFAACVRATIGGDFVQAMVSDTLGGNSNTTFVATINPGVCVCACVRTRASLRWRSCENERPLPCDGVCVHVCGTAVVLLLLTLVLPLYC